MTNSGGKFTNIDEQLEFSSVKVAINGTFIVYIVNVPITGNEVCENLKLKSIKKNNIINKIGYNQIFRCNGRIYGIPKPCKNFNDITVCKATDLINLENNVCIKNLLTNVKPNCTKINADHIADNEELEPGMLLLNDFEGNVTIGGETTRLQGTFIIMFRNSTIEIGTRKFVSRQISNLQPLPAILQLWGPVDNIEQVLSLEMMKDLQLNNTRHIEIIKRDKAIEMTINVSFCILILITISILMVKIRKRKGEELPEEIEKSKTSNMILEQKGTPSGETHSETPSESTVGGDRHTVTFVLKKGGVNATLCKYPELFTFSAK